MNHHSFKNALASAVLTLVVTAPALSFGAPQGGTDGGGGNAIVCFNNPSITKKIYSHDNPHRGTITEDMLQAITSVETYDLAYAKLPSLDRQPKIVPIEPNEAFDDYARRIAKRAAISAPEIQWVVDLGLIELKYNKALIRQNGVMSVSDMADVGVVNTNRCVVSTMAVQVLDSQNPLNLDGRLFQHPKHSRQSQATLILHEILYAAARKYFNATDSSGVRELIRMIITENAGYTKRDITDLMAKHFPTRQAGTWTEVKLPSLSITEPAISTLYNEAVILLQKYSQLAPRTEEFDEIQILVQLSCASKSMKDILRAITWGEDQHPAIIEFGWKNVCKNVDTSDQVLLDMLPKAKAVWSELLDAQTQDKVNWKGESLFANGLKDALDKMHVRSEEQAVIKEFFDKNLVYGHRPDNEMWNKIESELRNSAVELP